MTGCQYRMDVVEIRGRQVLVLVRKLLVVKNVFKEQVGCDESIIQREQDEGRRNKIDLVNT